MDNSCKYCGKLSENKNFCSLDHYYKWKIENYKAPEWKKELKNWIVISFSHRVKRKNYRGYLNYWNVQCKNCEFSAARAEGQIIRDKRCKICRNRPQGEAGLLELFANYKKECAKKRGHVFNLTLSEFKNITSSPCHYCGVFPYKYVRGKSPSMRKHLNEWGNYIYNGVDQKVPGRGYTIDNVLPACEKCNFAKRDYSYEEFIIYLERIVKFRSIN